MLDCGYLEPPCYLNGGNLGEGEQMDNATLLGIVLTVIFGIAGLFIGSRIIKKKSQSQIVKGGQMVIQSGRDTNLKK